MASTSLLNRIALKILNISNKLWSDKLFIKIKFWLNTGYWPNLKNPKSFNEKLQWLKLYDRNPEYTVMVDKIKSKEWVYDKLNDKTVIIPTIGVWESIEDLNLDSLPDKFVLKTNHDSGCVHICTDKSKFDIDKAKKDLDKSLRNNYFYVGREWPYKNVKPLIFAEKLLEFDSSGDVPDYKLMCFNGKVVCSFVCTGRNTPEGLHVTFFDRDWNVLPLERKYKKSTVAISKPKNYEKMVRYAEVLSAGIDFLRVDFYSNGDNIYIGELTFYPGNGWESFNPIEWDYRLGEYINI